MAMTNPCPQDYSLINGQCIYTGSPPNVTCPPNYYMNDSGNCVPFNLSCPSGYAPNGYGQCIPITIGLSETDWIIIAIAAGFVLLAIIWLIRK